MLSTHYYLIRDTTNHSKIKCPPECEHSRDSKNEINRAIAQLLCTYRLNWAERTDPEDGDMSEITLSSRHIIRNSNLEGLMPSTLPLGHGGSPKIVNAF